MSKITPKNLHYDTSLPPFLARLQAGDTSNGRHEFNAARPKKVRSKEEQAEDEPVVFDEGSGETMSREEWEKREGLGGDVDEAKEIEERGETGEVGHEVKEAKEKVARIGGGTKKRKAGKIVGGEGQDGGIAKVDTVSRDQNDAATEKDVKKNAKKMTAKKGKKIKLSFGDDD